eukprot:COSAG01_NODE_455_length_16792_cov_112.440424_7_plen_154_part_00
MGAFDHHHTNRRRNEPKRRGISVTASSLIATDGRDCNIIGAPWLANGGHGASLNRQHNVSAQELRGELLQLTQRPALVIAQRPARLRLRRRRRAGPCRLHHLPTSENHRYCNMIEAPWLVNGGHGASFRHHNGTCAETNRNIRKSQPLIQLLS